MIEDHHGDLESIIAWVSAAEAFLEFVAGTRVTRSEVAALPPTSAGSARCQCATWWRRVRLIWVARSSGGAGVTLASLATMGGELVSDRMRPVVGTAAAAVAVPQACNCGAEVVSSVGSRLPLPQFAEWGHNGICRDRGPQSADSIRLLDGR